MRQLHSPSPRRNTHTIELGEPGEVIHNDSLDWGVEVTTEVVGNVLNMGATPAKDVPSATWIVNGAEKGVNRAWELAGEVATLEPKLTFALSTKSTIGLATREGTSVIAANNQNVYDALLKHTQSGAIALQPGEFLASPHSVGNHHSSRLE